MRFQACTIITRNYLPQARVLYRSFCQFHPDIRFSALVFDAGRSAVDEPFDVFVLEDIGLPRGEETRMPMLYDVTELATALKPWFFRHLLAREHTELLYFDPDIEIFSPLDRLGQLAREHCLVMTPHTTRPMSRGDVRPNETDILSAGAYNLGFLGLNSDCAPFLAWWSERLLREAMIDVANMRFTDQRWMDFAPGYFDTCILKDETCNVAYWNADSRPLSWTGTHYEVKGQPLCFFHFSGFKPENPHLLSSHQSINPRTRLSEHPALARLCREYAEKLAIADYVRLQRLPYGLEKAPGALKVTRPMRLAYRTALRKHEETGTPAPPSAFSDPAAFIAWLNEPLHPRKCPEITRYFWAIHEARPDLRAVFPNLLGMDNAAYYEWLRHSGRYEIPIPDELIPPAPANTAIVTEHDRTAAPVRGVSLVGYLRAELGIGEAGRLMAAALEASGERQSTYVWSETASRQNHPWNDASSLLATRHDTNIICINADRLPAFAQEIGPEFFDGCYNIGLWFWEAEVFPAAMHGGFNFLHEVWVPSEFVREAIAKVSPIPVFTVPLPLNLGKPIPPSTTGVTDPGYNETSRAALNLPEGFLFLFSFDFFSVVERKNPVGVIKAFQRAFAPGEGPTLVIKSINGNRNLAELERLHYARGDRSDIIIRDGYLSAAERDALVAACDCYVSLHRAEGFGLTIAEAMLIEKPTIATRYSGNLQFMTDSNSFLCGYNLRRVGHGVDPYPSDARWADPNIAEAAELMRFVYENPEEARRSGKRARLDLRARHDPRIVAAFIKSRLSQLRQKPPASVPFAAQHPERPLVRKVRAAIEQGVNVRRTVPSLLTWILQGPRRAMKQFLRAYDQHHRRVGLSALDAFKEIDAEWLRERASLNKRMSAQEDEVRVLKEELKKARQRLSAMEKELPGGAPAPPSAPVAAVYDRRGARSDPSSSHVIRDSVNKPALSGAGRVNRADRPSQSRRVVYTCLFGYSEKFNDLVYERDGTIDFICFTDMPELQSDFWRIEKVERGELDATRAAKRRKILAHCFLSRYNASLYLDNTVRLKIPPAEIFDRYLDHSRSPFVCFRHPSRQSIYDEAREVISRNFDTPERVNSQMRRYRELGYPQANELWKGAFLLRRHNDPAVIPVMETWFEHVRTYSHRDQLSLPIAAWLHKFKPEFIELDFTDNDILEYPYPPNPIRLPRGFDDERYLRLNPDVRAANMDPRRHYLLHGAAEGRLFR